MARSELLQSIFEFFTAQAAAGRSELSRREVEVGVAAPTATVVRYLEKLVVNGQLVRLGRAANTRYRLADPATQPAASVGAASAQGQALAQVQTGAINWSDAAKMLMVKLDAPLGVRKPVSYQRKFVDDYQPNQTFLLPVALADALYQEGRMQGQQPAGTYARNVIAPLLIDLSFSSSRLEGNRYSRLDTEVLFEAGRAEPGDKDATMLLNHKQAFEFLVEDVPHYGLCVPIIRNLHTLLMQGLLADEEALGTIRNKVVNITNTVYVPTHAPQLLEEMLTQIIEKAKEIKNPVEAAFFLWINIAYLQPFDDGNKRTSRLSANIPLLLYNCAPLSFLDVSDDDYARARIGVYELLDTSIAADLFAWTYRRSIAKYAALIAAAGQPDPFRMKYREVINDIVGQVVRGEALTEAVTELGLESQEAIQLQEMIKGDLTRLGEHNFSRYRLRMREVQEWIARGRPVAD
ncbi:Fic family protein [Cupriavidus sp. DF5525]|uniref:Fic family protein n=1 Tax=Cupriavidus sp. DF5525 TaxID=3160989 RepID=UPI0032DF6C48